MSDPVIGVFGIIGLLALIGLGVPIGIALFCVSFIGIYTLFGWAPAIGALKIIPYDFAASWDLSSVPMFLFMGYFAYHAGITRGLFEAAQLWLRRLPGGLAVASIFGATGFAAVTGSSVATAAAMGRIAVPEMARAGYDMRLATGTVAAAGTIGALIPPSIIFILYGIIAQVPITQLFLGGAVAGILTALSYVAVIIIWVKLRPEIAPRVTEAVPPGAQWAALRGVLPVLVLILLVFGGLFGGLFTATEAGAVGAALTVMIAAFERKLTRRSLYDAAVEASLTTAALLFIAVGANLLARFVTLSGVDDLIAELIISTGSGQLYFLLTVVVLYLILGLFLEPIGSMLITLPIILPAAALLDVNLIWLGILVAKLLETGMITPPIGLNVFVIKSVLPDNVSVGTIFSGVAYFLIGEAFVIAAIVLFPGLIMFLPDMLR